MNGKRSPAGRPEECPVSDDHRRPDMGLDALWRLPLFSGLSRAFLEDLLGETKRIRVGRGTALFIQGERADRFYVLLRGWVKLYRIDDEGAETVLRVVAPGEAFAEAAMFASGRFPVCGQAAEDAELLVVPARALLDRLRADPELALRMLGTLSARMRYLVGRLDRAQTVSARRRPGRGGDGSAALRQGAGGSATRDEAGDAVAFLRPAARDGRVDPRRHGHDRRPGRAAALRRARSALSAPGRPACDTLSRRRAA